MAGLRCPRVRWRKTERGPSSASTLPLRVAEEATKHPVPPRRPIRFLRPARVRGATVSPATDRHGVPPRTWGPNRTEPNRIASNPCGAAHTSEPVGGGGGQRRRPRRWIVGSAGVHPRARTDVAPFCFFFFADARHCMLLLRTWIACCADSGYVAWMDGYIRAAVSAMPYVLCTPYRRGRMLGQPSTHRPTADGAQLCRLWEGTQLCGYMCAAPDCECWGIRAPYRLASRHAEHTRPVLR